MGVDPHISWGSGQFVGTVVEATVADTVDIVEGIVAEDVVGQASHEPPC